MPTSSSAEPPDSTYVRRLATFRAFDSLALWGFLTAGPLRPLPGRAHARRRGARSPACYLTINGAVEKVIVRGGRRIRVGLAGPGQAFGYESLIDGGPSPVTAATRERTLLLVLPQEAFGRLFDGETAGSHVFLDVIHRDLMAALRQALRPHARLAVQPLAGKAGREVRRDLGDVAELRRERHEAVDVSEVRREPERHAHRAARRHADSLM